MATTLHELIYHVRNAVRGGLGNDNDPIPLNYIGRIIDQARAAVLKDEWRKGIDHTLLEQDIGVLQPVPWPLRKNTVNGSDLELETKEVNKENAPFYFYRNLWYVEIPELIGLPRHQDLRIAAAADDVFTVPMLDQRQLGYSRYLKFTGSQSSYCWNKGLTKVIPHENHLMIETGHVQSEDLAAKNAATGTFISALHQGTPLVDKDPSDPLTTIQVYQPFVRVHAIYARPTEASGWADEDPDTQIESAKTMRYPVTEILKDLMIAWIKDNILQIIKGTYLDRSNNFVQEEDKMDTLESTMPTK